MRHGKRINHLGRTSSHRKAMLSNMASSLILHKRISTTVAKAKELRKYVEPLLTKSKEDSTHSRRQVFSYLQNKESVKVLFDDVAEKISTRAGGYTRIIKLGNRLGDNAEMCVMELVDYNELLLKEETAGKTKKRTRRAGKKAPDAAQSPAAKAETKPAAEKESAKAETEEPKAEAQKDVKAEASPSVEENQAEAPKPAKGEEPAGDEDKKKDE